ncbi:MAG: type II toxin-antitoxin system HicA family toxin [Dehalococcoidia bacterium]
MPRRFSSDEVIRALARIGIEPVRQRGSHVRLQGHFRGETRNVTVPIVRGTQDPRTLSSILRQAGISRTELETLVDGENIDG